MKKLVVLMLALILAFSCVSALADNVKMDRLTFQFVPPKDADVIITGTANLPELVKAEMAKLELMELQGSMHRSEDVRAMTEDLVYTMRSALLSLPGRLARDAAEAASAAEALSCSFISSIQDICWCWPC